MQNKRALLLITLTISALTGCGGGDDSSSPNYVPNLCESTTYPDQSTSVYILPWSVGETYQVGQGNCTDFSHTISTNQQFAYDFYMPIGTAIRAARSGVVAAVEDSFIDGTGISGQENYIFIRHDDGTVSRYAHITIQGALFEWGDIVIQGDIIALSGNSGFSTAAHLHFDVNDGECEVLTNDCDSLPVTFQNTTEHPNGLVEGVSYTAE
jgi:murein DD-endopeptidase MepM/ murein hydrolase activator NlpD